MRNTERAWNDDEVPDSAACLQHCSAAVYTDHSHQSRVGFPRTENTAGWAAVLCSDVHCTAPLHHSAPAQIEFLSEVVTNE